MLRADWPLHKYGELGAVWLTGILIFIVYFLWAAPISVDSENGGENRFLCGFRETAERTEPLEQSLRT